MPERLTTAVKDPSPASAGGGSSASAGIGDGVELGTEWVQTQIARVRTAIELSLAETRLAASSLQWMLFLAVITAVLSLTAWGILVAATIIALSEAGLALWISLFAVAAVHGVIAGILFMKILALGDNLALPVTRRHLFGSDEEAATS